MYKSLDLSWLFMADSNSFQEPHFSYYTYTGSLTSPQCDENTTWFISSDIIQVSSTIVTMMSDAQFSGIDNEYEETLGGKNNSDSISNMLDDVMKTNSEGNYRSLQPLNDREVYYFDKEASCDHDDLQDVETPSSLTSVIINFLRKSRQSVIRKAAPTTTTRGSRLMPRDTSTLREASSRDLREHSLFPVTKQQPNGD